MRAIQGRVRPDDQGDVMRWGRTVACAVFALALASGGLACESAPGSTGAKSSESSSGQEVAVPAPTGAEATPPLPTPGPAVAPVVVTPASVTSIAPRTGPSGSQVAITGTGFNSVKQVCFGNVASPHYRVSDSGTRITAVVPPGSGSVPIAVITAAGPSAVRTDDTFTYRSSTIANGAVGSAPTCALTP